MSTRDSGNLFVKSLTMTLGGCGLLSLCSISLMVCAVIGVVADAAYWRNSQRSANITPISVSNESPIDFDTLPVGDASAGEQIFKSNGGCHACHSLAADKQIIGPSLSGVAQRAATHGVAELYIYNSIVSPDAYIVDGFPGRLMPSDFGKRLSDQQLADLIAFLMTQ